MYPDSSSVSFNPALHLTVGCLRRPPAAERHIARRTGMDSAGYRAFAEAFLQPGSWATRKDGCPLELLDALTPEEKHHAERALLAALGGDSWHVQALGRLRAESALPALRAMLATATAELAGHVAVAIWKIAGDSNMPGRVLELSRVHYTEDPKSSKTFTMIELTYCLAEMRTADTDARIVELRSSGNYLIQWNASRCGPPRNAHTTDPRS